MTTGPDNKDQSTLDAIADRLDRIATALEAGTTAQGALDIDPAVDAFVWHTGPDALVPVPQVNRVGFDLLRGIDPAASRANLSGILQVAEARALPVLLVGVEAPSNYGAEYKAAFDGMYLELAEEFGALFHENFLGALLDGNDRQTALAELMQGDAIHPNAAGVALIVADVGPRVVELVTLAQR